MHSGEGFNQKVILPRNIWFMSVNKILTDFVHYRALPGWKM